MPVVWVYARTPTRLPARSPGVWMPFSRRVMRQPRWKRDATTAGSRMTGRPNATAWRPVTIASSAMSKAWSRTIGAKALCTGDTSTKSKVTSGLLSAPLFSGADRGDVASTVRRRLDSAMLAGLRQGGIDRRRGATEDHRLVVGRETGHGLSGRGDKRGERAFGGGEVGAPGDASRPMGFHQAGQERLRRRLAGGCRGERAVGELEVHARKRRHVEERRGCGERRAVGKVRPRAVI